jgi:Zn-dependent M28 family amino/carboxypeptidase
MHRAQALLILMASLPALAADFNGAAALEFTRKAVSFGPRPPASQANLKEQAWIKEELHQLAQCQVSDDAFTAQTPLGPTAMRNIIAKFAGTSSQAIVITGHFDTKLFPGRRFVGANDGGASAGLLLELARVVSSRSRPDDIYLVWFDGEEAIGEWSATDGLHGSRHLASKWSQDGTISRIKALVNVDMIGDRDLGILQVTNSSPQLLRLVWQIARENGYGKYFLDSGSDVEDDHIPFVRLGVNALDLIDFDYGPGNRYWHTDQDTMDKLSAHSLEVVGNVLVEMIRRLGR